ncbi:MAG: 50S ribosomal protein L9 [Nitrospirae bacterium]|nr:MAG: 50S ribosomal protein L9 [Nitrospirota bacterium]
MKVILKEDVDRLGSMGDIVNVKPGYARNYLIPRNLAVEANPRNIKEFEHYKRTLQQKAERIKNAAQILADKISSTPLVIKVKAGEEDKLFGSVTSIDIEKALKDKGFEIDRKTILLDEPIKRLGEYKVKVKLHRDVTAEITLQVEKED